MLGLGQPLPNIINNLSTWQLNKYSACDKLVHATILSHPIVLAPDLKERALYVTEPAQCKATLDEFSIIVKLCVENKKLKFQSQSGKIEALINEYMI